MASKKEEALVWLANYDFKFTRKEIEKQCSIS